MDAARHLFWKICLLLAIQIFLCYPTVQVPLAEHNYSIRSTPECQLQLVQKSQQPAWFESPERGKSSVDFIVFQVTSTSTSGAVCQIPIDKVLCESECPQDMSRTFYPVLICNKQARSQVIFTNPKGLHTDLLSYLHLKYCEVSLQNIGIYGQAVDLRIVHLVQCSLMKDRNVNITSGLAQSPSSHREGDLVPVPGLEKVVALTVHQENNTNSLPPLFFTHLWPVMAEVKLDNFNTTDLEMYSLQRTMPRLQSLEMSKVTISSIPDFPWDPLSLALPHNLSRTALTNEIYAGSQGIDLEPYLFRRTFNLEACGIENITDIQFTGRLDMISLTGNRIREIGRDTFSNIEGLFNLKLDSNFLTYLPDGVFRNLWVLVQLDLNFNDLRTISQGVFEGLSNLKILKISHNHLQMISSNTFAYLGRLVSLDLSNNSMNTFANDAFGLDISNDFAIVNLDFNKLSHFPEWVFYTRSLVSIQLSRNRISFEAFVEDLDNLTENIVSFNNRESAGSLLLPYKPRRDKLIDVSHNNFTSLDFRSISQDSKRIVLFTIILNFFNIDLKGNKIRCDCQTYSMRQFLKNEQQTPFLRDYSKARILASHYDSWRCTPAGEEKARPIVEVPSDSFMCQKHSEKCPHLCTCFVRIFDGSVLVNCSGKNLKHFPKTVPKFTDTIIFSHNEMEHMGNAYYLNSLKTLDVSNNYIKEIDDGALASLASISEAYLHNNLLESIPDQFKHLENVQLTLSGNVFVCDCNTKWIVRWIFSYRTHISDINNVVCGSGVPQSKVIYLADEEEFVCEISKRTVIAIAIAVGILMTLVLILLLVAYKYRGEIKVILYFHFNWHPFDRTDGTDVVDKLYDAFVSYSKDDTQWVLQTLRPALETDEHPFRLCIHERDFKPGGLITDNVLYSVKYSRRMIMLLTKNFLKSEWCRLEFKSAHRRVLKDRTNYLIVILFDGLDLEDLDEDMKLYLKTNTYIESDSKWFWQGLRYAMPLKPLSVLREEAFPKRGFETLFPCPESVAIMQHVQNVRTLAKDPEAEIQPVVMDTEFM